ncbi:hypothetical protein KEM55_004104 [Ascosphaera atra]|nr:hypothetical protein KEM55_004104 [Ascosphaera atra]
MANPLDTDAGTELFATYEGDLKLLQADLNQQLDQISEATSGEERKSIIRKAEAALEEASELLDQMRLEKANVPPSSRNKINVRFRNYLTDIDETKRRLKSVSDDRRALFDNRYTDDPTGDADGPGGQSASDRHLAQRQQLLSGTERLGRSSARLTESQRIANETEGIAASTMADLHRQREVLEHTRGGLLESEGYVDRSVKTLRGMARR